MNTALENGTLRNQQASHCSYVGFILYTTIFFFNCNGNHVERSTRKHIFGSTWLLYLGNRTQTKSLIKWSTSLKQPKKRKKSAILLENVILKSIKYFPVARYTQAQLTSQSGCSLPRKKSIFMLEHECSPPDLQEQPFCLNFNHVSFHHDTCACVWWAFVYIFTNSPFAVSF